jgi:hypothetical protein
MDYQEEVELGVAEKIVGIIWRSIVVGAIYTLITFGLGAVLTRQGVPFPDMDKLGVGKLWFLGASVVMAFVIGAISQIVHTSKLNHILTWTILLFLNPFSVSLESAVLAPNILNATIIPGLMLVQFLAALVTALLITFLFASSSKQVFGSYIHRPWSVWSLRLAICIGIAFLLYSLLSATDYHLITQLYFQTYHIPLALPTTEVIFAIQFMKAFLVVLSLIPMIITIGATKRFIAVISGITLVVLCALSPFLQVSNLSMFLLLASSGKLFLQNFLIGILAGWILGCPSRLEEEGITTIEYLRPILRGSLLNVSQSFTKPFQVLPTTAPAPAPDPELAENQKTTGIEKKPAKIAGPLVSATQSESQPINQTPVPISEPQNQESSSGESPSNQPA